MPQISISVNGQVISLPGAYVQTIPITTVPTGELPTGPLVFIANSYGGVPLTPINFTDANTLLAAMRGAPSSDFVQFFFNPSGQLAGTSLLTLINVSPNTQSTASIVNAGNTPVISLTSADYGTPSNLIQYSIGTASVAGIAMTLLDGFSNTSFTGDNLGVPFQLAYTGDATSVTYTVQFSSSANVATSLVINSSDVGETVVLDLTSQTYSTISQVVQFLNGTGFYDCIMLGNGNLPSSSLDTGGPITLPAPVSNVNQYVNVSATLGDIVYWVNTVGQSIASAAITPAITSSVANVPMLTSLQFFSGATNGIASLGDYASGLNIAMQNPAWVVFCDSNSAGVRALGAQHAASASTVANRKWRRFVTGSALAETAPVAQANGRALNEIMATYVWPGIKRVNLLTGNTQTYDGLHAAAAAAGMMTGNSVVTPLTNKSIQGSGVETIVDVSTKSALQSNGVLVLDYPADTKIPTFLADVTTWQNDNTPANVFNQQVSCRFALSYAISRAMQVYIGTVASTFDITRAKNSIKQLLNSQIYNGLNNGVINSWDPNSLVLTYDSATQTLYVNVSVVFVGQNLYIVVTVAVNPLNISINAQGVVTTG